MLRQRTFIATFKMFGTMKEIRLLRKKVKSLSQEKGMLQVDIREDFGVFEEE